MLILIFEKVGVNIGLWIITPLFKLAAFAFKIFMILAQSDVLKEIHYDRLLTNFYVILGLIMLFVMAFALLRGIVNPDDQKQGTTVVKNIIINFVISCVILGFLPTIFPFMFDVQDSILRYNVIGGFFGYGYTGGEELTETTNVNEVEASAYRLVNGIFTAFFNVSDGYCTNFLSNGDKSGDSEEVYKGKTDELIACQKSLSADTTQDSELTNAGYDSPENFYEYKQYVDRTGQFGVYSVFVDQIADGDIDFDFIVSLIAGIAMLYVATSYCFDMGLRLIKLIFYQVIAPIPVFLRIVPNSKLSGTFNQWLKVTLTCWMEVFVRIFIFCFCTWLCSAIMETDFITKTVYDYGRTTGLFTTAFILMAVVMFMKRSPKLLSEITGIDSGNMKLGIKEKLAEGGGFVAGAAIGAGASTLAKNATNAIRNYNNQFERDANGKVIKVGGKKLLKNGNLANAGTRFWGALGGIASITAGAASGAVRGGKAGMGAKNAKDMKNSAVSGAQGAVDARTKRANYRAANSSGNSGVSGWIEDSLNVLAAHGKQTITSVGDFVGVKSAEQLKRENYAMEQVTNAIDTFDNTAESMINKEVDKGKGNIVGIDLTKYSNLRRELANKKAQGTATAADEEAVNKALREIRYQLQEKALLSNKNYMTLNADDRAKLSSLRTAGVNLKGAIRNNAGLEALQEAGIVGANFSDDVDLSYGYSKGDYKVTDANGNTLYTIKDYDDNPWNDKMGKSIKRHKGDNDVAIAQKTQQKYEEKK